jgi:hypothetical protein
MLIMATLLQALSRVATSGDPNNPTAPGAAAAATCIDSITFQKIYFSPLRVILLMQGIVLWGQTQRKLDQLGSLYTPPLSLSFPPFFLNGF